MCGKVGQPAPGLWERLPGRPALLTCHASCFANGKREVVRLAAPHPPCWGEERVLFGTKHGEEWVLFLAEIRPAGTYHTWGFVGGREGGMGMSTFCKAHVSC